MNQQRLQSYIALIKKLLACSSGEEWILLRQNETLVTPELVQVMEQVAAQLTSWGNLKEATFLHNLAGQIHHLFVSKTIERPDREDKSQAYLDFIQALLDCPTGSEEELLTANQELIGPGLVHTMQQVASQLAANGDRESAIHLQHWAIELNRFWVEQHDFQPTAKQESEPKSIEYQPAVTQSIPPPLQNPQPSEQGDRGSLAPTETEEDIWADQPEKPAETSAQPLPSVETSLTEAAKATPAQDLAPKPELSNSSTYEQINRHLETIAGALSRLSETLTSFVQPPADPLWYMEALERANAGNWILTSGEIEKLIGVKPTCPKGSESFQRGSWIFIKAGKVGTQTGWRVNKENEARSPKAGTD
jgi:hypothetical protein